MFSMQRVLSAAFIAAVLVLPFVGHSAAQASANPVEAPKAQETPKTAQDVSVPTLSVRELPDAPVKVQTAKETIIRHVRTAKAKAPIKQYACGGWEESQVGGGYRRCDWR